MKRKFTVEQQLEKVKLWVETNNRLPDIYSESPREQGWGHWMRIHRSHPGVIELKMKYDSVVDDTISF